MEFSHKPEDVLRSYIKQDYLSWDRKMKCARVDIYSLAETNQLMEDLLNPSPYDKRKYRGDDELDVVPPAKPVEYFFHRHDPARRDFLDEKYVEESFKQDIVERIKQTVADIRKGDVRHLEPGTCLSEKNDFLLIGKREIEPGKVIYSFVFNNIPGTYVLDIKKEKINITFRGKTDLYLRFVLMEFFYQLQKARKKEATVYYGGSESPPNDFEEWEDNYRQIPIYRVDYLYSSTIPHFYRILDLGLHDLKYIQEAADALVEQYKSKTDDTGMSYYSRMLVDKKFYFEIFPAQRVNGEWVNNGYAGRYCYNDRNFAEKVYKHLSKQKGCGHLSGLGGNVPPLIRIGIPGRPKPPHLRVLNARYNSKGAIIQPKTIIVAIHSGHIRSLYDRAMRGLPLTDQETLELKKFMLRYRIKWSAVSWGLRPQFEKVGQPVDEPDRRSLSYKLVYSK